MQNIHTTKITTLSKRSLGAHKWLGLFVSAFMYIICLSGTVAVFHQEIERWEQPQVQESTNVNINTIGKAYDTFVDKYSQDTEHMHVVFPSSGIPRLVVENDDIAHFVNNDGSLGEIERPHWSKMLVDLHLYLHLPKNFGMVLVSAMGALLCGMIISGFFAHPRILKDAFRFRRGGTGLQENIDLHNRLSVWAAPFHLMIGITGAYFGLAGLLVIVMSQAFYAGDTQAVIDQVFTPEPTLEQELQRPNIEQAITYVRTNDPDGKMLFLTVHEPNTPGQFIEIYVQQPGRLIYSENYRFDVSGNFLNTGDYKNGELGKQAIYSIYRLHFGDFNGPAGKLLYFVLGLMLTIVSATGINIWLNKRKTKDIINYCWPAIVWGSVLALVISAWLNLFINMRLDFTVWLVIVGTMVYGVWQKHEETFLIHIKTVLGASILLFLLSYAATFGIHSFNLASLQINLPLLIFAIALLVISMQKRINRTPIVVVSQPINNHHQRR